jgi:mannosyltransferase OCH1-like enzyme
MSNPNTALFPPVLHQIWVQGWKAAPAACKKNFRHWSAINGSKVQSWFWDETKIISFIRRFYPEFFKLFSDLDKPVKKADLARVLIMHHYGGFYLDMDLVPRRPIHEFMDSDTLLHRKTKMTKANQLPPSEPSAINFYEYDIIVSREHRPIDEVGWGVANGVMISHPGQDLWLDFAKAQMHQAKARVLDFMGPWALTRFIRPRTESLNIIAVAPYYFLWEKPFGKPEEWVVAEHPNVNTWGDPNKKKPWMA